MIVTVLTKNWRGSSGPLLGRCFVRFHRPVTSGVGDWDIIANYWTDVYRR